MHFLLLFFVAFSKLEACCKPSFENTLSNSKWTIEWSFENLEQATVGNLNSRIGNCMFQIPLIENSAARKTCKKLNTKQSRQVHSGYVNIISRTAECESLVVCFFSMVMGHFDTSWVSQGENSLILGLKNEEWEIFNLKMLFLFIHKLYLK